MNHGDQNHDRAENAYDRSQKYGAKAASSVHNGLVGPDNRYTTIGLA